MHDGSAVRRAIELRAQLYALARAFFAERGVVEVETPILSAAGNTEPNIESFATRFSGHLPAGSRERWLRTSPEHALKRLLCTGVGDCFEIGRVFRNGEAGRRHNPEFTMLEWYRVGFDHRRLMRETAELVLAALRSAGRSADVVEWSYRELFAPLGLDPFEASDSALRASLDGIRIDPAGLSRDDWLDLAITHRIQPEFPRDRITIVYDFPVSQCALAKIRDGDRSDDSGPVAERFEVFLGPYELANGYHELTDADEQRRRFERDNARRRARGQREMPIDERFLAALLGMPACAGVALGVDRLLMCLAGSDDIADVIAFPFADA
jgi:lysyl-tRNA synthetase class 2